VKLRASERRCLGPIQLLLVLVPLLLRELDMLLDLRKSTPALLDLLFQRL
jgi:hypothetical protein